MTALLAVALVIFGGAVKCAMLLLIIAALRVLGFFLGAFYMAWDWLRGKRAA